MATAGIILCADDYGLSPGICDAILHLIEKSRLSATGCMTSCAYWADYGESLRSFRERADIGLHFTLTDQRACAAHPGLSPNGKFHEFPVLMKNAFLRRINPEEVRSEFRLQLERFRDVMGTDPDFIDGHQHIQQLPVIRDVVFSELTEQGLRDTCYVRSAVESPVKILRRNVAVLKCMSIGFMGKRVASLAKLHGVQINQGFAGFYDFGSEMTYGSFFRQFLDHASDNTLIMCHPGHVDSALKEADSLTAPREKEFQFLAGEEFPALLDEKSIVLKKYRS